MNTYLEAALRGAGLTRRSPSMSLAGFGVGAVSGFLVGDPYSSLLRSTGGGNAPRGERPSEDPRESDPRSDRRRG